MIAYAARRIMLMIPTLLAIMVVNFFIVQAAPGGPIDKIAHAVVEVLKKPEVAGCMRALGFEPRGDSGAVVTELVVASFHGNTSRAFPGDDESIVIGLGILG